MEASYSEQMKEEFRSTKAGILEDMREARLEKMRKKKAVGKGGRSWRSSKLKMEIVENTELRDHVNIFLTTMMHTAARRVLIVNNSVNSAILLVFRLGSDRYSSLLQIKKTQWSSLDSFFWEHVLHEFENYMIILLSILWWVDECCTVQVTRELGFVSNSRGRVETHLVILMY